MDLQKCWSLPEKQDRNLEDVLRVIELCRTVSASSVNPFEVDIKSKLIILKKHLPGWKLLDELLLDSEALNELVQIVKLQDQYLKHRASSLYIDPLLLELKIKLLSRDDLADSFVRSWHPIARLDQLTPRGLEKAFIYWRDLIPFSERFKEPFGKYGTGPGQIDYDVLLGMEIFTKEQFEAKLNSLQDELVARAKGGEIDYREFIRVERFEETAVRAYLVAFLVTEGRASLRVDPLTEQITLFPLSERATGESKSVAIEVERLE